MVFNGIQEKLSILANFITLFDRQPYPKAGKAIREPTFAEIEEQRERKVATAYPDREQKVIANFDLMEDTDGPRHS